MSEEFSGDSILESCSPLDEICALSHQLPENAHIFRWHSGAGYEVSPEELSQSLCIYLVSLDLDFWDGSHLEWISQHYLKSSFLDSLVDELPDARRLEGKLSPLKASQELVQFVLG